MARSIPEMKQIAIREAELVAVIPDEKDSNFAMIFTPAEGEPMLLSMDRSVAETIAVRMTEAIQRLQRDETQMRVPPSPEKILGYNAKRGKDAATGEHLVALVLKTDRSQPLFGVMTAIDANRFGAALMAESQSPAPGKPAN